MARISRDARYNRGMTGASEHYRNLLARHYSWMFGMSFADKVAEQKAILSEAFERMSLSPGGVAVDLGCGPGYQTLALLELGFSPVTAIDTSAELLTELRAHAEGQPVDLREADLRFLPEIVQPGAASAIVCMGDTLTHLPSHDDVRQLLRDASGALAAGGAFIVTWRDLTTELHGLDRFLPIRSDDSTIMTCFLEYQSADTAMVHDLIYTRTNGAWALNKSCYPKLRIAGSWLAQQLREAGFAIDAEDNAGRLQRLVASKR